MQSDKSIKICLLTFMLFLNSAISALAEDQEYLQLVAQGKPAAIVLLPPEPSTGEQKAAEELVRCVNEISGADLQIHKEPDYPGQLNLISIGKTKLAAQSALADKLKGLPADSYLLNCNPKGDRIYLLGNNDLGNLLAVYGLLNSIGMRWFLPDELGRIIPKQQTLRLTASDEVFTPDIPYRAIGFTKAAQWSAVNGNNVNIDEKLGVHFYGFAHTFFDFLPPEQYFEKHPEFFSLVKGKRVAKQLCTSNPAVIAEVSQNILSLAKKRPELDVITLFPQDGRGFCECANCKALDEAGLPTVEDVNRRWPRLGPDRYRALSRRMLAFYLAVSDNVLKNNNKINLQVGAYNAYLYPPRQRNNMKAPARMMIEMCHGVEHNHPIVTKDSEINIRFREALAGWREIFEQISIYEYYWKLAMFDLPFPILHVMQEDISFFANQKIQSFYTQFGTDYYTNGQNYYIASRLLWDSNQNVWSLLDEFCQNLYGNAWKPMRDYYVNYEKAAISADIDLSPPVDQLDRLFSGSLLKSQELLLQQAMSQAENAQEKERIRRVQISLTYTKMCMDYLQAAENAALGASSGLRKLGAQANQIKSFRTTNKASHCFNRDTNYTKRFFDPDWLLDQVSGGK